MRKKVTVTDCPVCGLKIIQRRKLEEHLLKNHGKVMDRFGYVMESNIHPVRAKEFGSDMKGMHRPLQGGAPGSGKRR